MQIKRDKRTLLSLLKLVLPTLSDYSIGFAMLSSEGNAQDARLGGSGTLVTIDQINGILTARHVIKSLKARNESVGLILTSQSQIRPHRIELRLSHCREISFCDESTGDINQPDLALLVLPPDLVGTLKAKRSFYNLSVRRGRMIKRPPLVADGFWVLSGFVDEWTKERAAGGGFSKVKAFHGTHGLGRVTRAHSRGKFDYRIYRALYNEHYQGPDSFRGVSGGALWQILVKSKGRQLRIADAFLSGVAFYQSDKKKARGRSDKRNHLPR